MAEKDKKAYCSPGFSLRMSRHTQGDTWIWKRMMLRTGALRKGDASPSRAQGQDAHPPLLSQPSRNVKPDPWIAERSSIGKLEKGVRAESASHNANINCLSHTYAHCRPPVASASC